MIELVKRIKSALYTFYKLNIYPLNPKKYGFYGKGVNLGTPLIVTNPAHVYLHDNTNIFGFSFLIIGYKEGKFVMKKNSGAAQGLTVVTANHSTNPSIGMWHKEFYKDITTDSFGDVIIEEDVWIAANVTLLPNVTVGRGSIVGAGSVCRKSIPPYAIAIGNPAKIIGFKYTPEEIIEHEKILYPEDERLSIEVLERNYRKYYSKRIKDISVFLK